MMKMQWDVRTVPVANLPFPDPATQRPGTVSPVLLRSCWFCGMRFKLCVDLCVCLQVPLVPVPEGACPVPDVSTCVFQYFT